jgi:hypothetical protein
MEGLLLAIQMPISGIFCGAGYGLAIDLGGKVATAPRGGPVALSKSFLWLLCQPLDARCAGATAAPQSRE